MTTDDWLLRLLAYLKQHDYRFTVVTPATHALVLTRPPPPSPSLRDVFGWNRGFARDQIDPALIEIMERAGCLVPAKDGFRSAFRVASLGEDLFMHSAFPTDEVDAVFLGPDTYRFARFVAGHLPAQRPARVVDLGAGSGAGGIRMMRLVAAGSLALVDTNRAALRLAAVNARAAGVAADLVEDSRVPPEVDLVIANPPYMMDSDSRTYRDGGGMLGGEIALDWARDTLDRLVPGGTLLLYTGVAFVGGKAPFLEALERLAVDAGATLHGEEIDPDVFGDELAKPPYAEVERIAAMGFRLRRAG